MSAAAGGEGKASEKAGPGAAGSGPETDGRKPQHSPVKGLRKGAKGSASTSALRTGPKKKMRRAKTAGAWGRTRKKLSAVKKISKGGGFAGYQAPDQAVDESAIGEAKSVMRDPESLAKILDDQVTVDAARAVGIEVGDLVPRPKSYFRTEPNRAEVLPKETQQRRFDHYENRRLWKLAVVLTAAEQGREAKKERMKRKTHLGDELYDVFNGAMEGETVRNKRIKGARDKVENVLLKENELLIRRRKEFAEREKMMIEREARIKRAQERRREELRQRGLKREKQLEKLQHTRKVRAASKVIAATNAFQARDMRVKEYLDAKRGAAGEERKHRDAMNAKRAAIREEARGRFDATRKELEVRLEQKSKQAEVVRAQRELDLAKKSEEKRLQAQSRMDNASRVRKVQQESRTKGADKMKAAYLRMELQRELREAIEDDRRAKKKEQIIMIDKWKEQNALERNVTPGPGEYHVEQGPLPAGGTWGKHKPKSDVEWQIYRAAQIPGPGEYDLPTTLAPAGGTWGKHKPKSDVEWQMYRASQIPGPGAYKPRELSGGAAVRFGDHDPPSQLEQVIRRAKDSPGPGAYSGEIMPHEKRKLKDIQKQLKLLAMDMDGEAELPEGLPDPSPVRGGAGGKSRRRPKTSG
mmetsp:Transcript_146357/g.355208  ORF Transcript_146357/g.355208 Transcript_146357/m.355208 type:complete len:639 (+) Transcript_146357:392-2308(+)